MTERKRSEIMAFLWAAVAVLLLLSLVSYNPSDIPFETSTTQTPLSNIVGTSGAYVSWALRFVFGTGSYFFVALFFIWALDIWADRRSRSLWTKVFSGSIFFISSCASLSLLTGNDPGMQFRQGGLIGFFLAHFLQELFGRAALYVSTTFFFLSVLLATEFLVIPILIGIVKALHDHTLESFKSAWTSRAKSQPMPIHRDSQPLKIRSNQEALTPENNGTPRPDRSDHKLFEAAPSKPIIRSLVTKKAAIPNRQSKTDENREPLTSRIPSDTSKNAYKLPSLDLLNDPVQKDLEGRAEIEQSSHILEQTLADFGIDAKVVEVEQGPTITRYELLPASGVKVQKIVALTDNIALAMQAHSVRIVAPIPGKSRVGIEIPNRIASGVGLKELIASDSFRQKRSKLLIAIGKDAAGSPVLTDLDGLPHLLIAGATGSGKTVCVNAIIITLLYNASPDELKLILIDPKRVELQGYNNLPHLLTPVLTEAAKVPAVLHWLVREMENRYRKLSEYGTRNITSYNAKKPDGQTMPYIVVVIDELADLMMTSGKEIEHTITRLSQLARAVGIHLVLATQRPSVNVITGVIKANFPARVAFQVASKVDSRTILDENGADALLGRGDLLFQDPSKPKPVRAQGAFLSDDEINRVTDFIRGQRETAFNEEVTAEAEKKATGTNDFRNDERYPEACRVIVTSGHASVSMLQRRLGLGYTRAARLVDMMEEDGIVGPHRGSKPREILTEIDELIARQEGAADTGAGSPDTPETSPDTDAKED